MAIHVYALATEVVRYSLLPSKCCTHVEKTKRSDEKIGEPGDKAGQVEICSD